LFQALLILALSRGTVHKVDLPRRDWQIGS